MKKIKRNLKPADFQKDLQKELRNARFKKHYDYYGKQLEIAYAILQLRKKQGLSQAQLAKKIGTKQSNVARMEAGQQNFTTDTLQKIAAAFNSDLKIQFVK